MLDVSLILDASLLPAILIAMFAGLLSFLSPCVLPIVPPYLAYMGGVSVSDMDETAGARRRVFLAAVFFVLDFRPYSCCWALPHLPWGGCFCRRKNGL